MSVFIGCMSVQKYIWDATSLLSAWPPPLSSASNVTWLYAGKARGARVGSDGSRGSPAGGHSAQWVRMSGGHPDLIKGIVWELSRHNVPLPSCHIHFFRSPSVRRIGTHQLFSGNHFWDSSPYLDINTSDMSTQTELKAGAISRLLSIFSFFCS